MKGCIRMTPSHSLESVECKTEKKQRRGNGCCDFLIGLSVGLGTAVRNRRRRRLPNRFFVGPSDKRYADRYEQTAAKAFVHASSATIHPTFISCSPRTVAYASKLSPTDQSHRRDLRLQVGRARQELFSISLLFYQLSQPICSLFRN